MKLVLDNAKEQLTEAFNTWKKQWEEHPESFTKLEDTDSSYGESCADMLVDLLGTVSVTE